MLHVPQVELRHCPVAREKALLVKIGRMSSGASNNMLLLPYLHQDIYCNTLRHSSIVSDELVGSGSGFKMPLRTSREIGKGGLGGKFEEFESEAGRREQ